MTENKASFTASSKALLALAAVCLAAFGLSLRSRQLLQDDWIMIGANPLLHEGLRGAWRLFVSGYWEAVLGGGVKVQEYRPLLMWTFLAQTSLHAGVPAMHALNLLLHFICCWLLLLVLRRYLAEREALFAALLFAAMPVHVEAVVLLTSRSELLSAALLLGAWLFLEDPRRTRLGPGLLLYGAAALTKESSVLLPAALALSDWTLHGERPWSPARRRVHADLWAATLAYLGWRQVVLGRDFHGGQPYFTSRLTALATLPGFYLRHYVWPSVSGLGLCTDYTKPLIPDGSFRSPAAWLMLAAAAAALAWSLRACLKRRAWGFAALGPALVLLPTCHLLMPLDTIGAQRFLYIPTMGLAAVLGAGLGRLGRGASWAALSAVLCWYVGLSAAQAAAWRTGAGYYERACACNPVSGRAMSGWGASLLSEGRVAEGTARLRRAMALSPGLAAPYYNMARLAWQKGDAPSAAAWASQAVSRYGGDADSWTLLGAALDAEGEEKRSRACLLEALSLWPQDAEAEYDLGRQDLKDGRARAARDRFARFLDLAPDDPQAGAIARLEEELSGAPRR